MNPLLLRKELLLYSIAGTLGTIIYFFARFYSKNLTTSVLLPVIIGQGCAIVFAFFANKYFVFKNVGVGFKKTCQQFLEFCIGRALVFAIDIGIAHFFVDKFGNFWIQVLRLQQINYNNSLFSLPMLQRFVGNPYLLNEFIFTLLSQVIGVVINYVVSKKIVFNLKKEQDIEMVY
ncbi:GtrA family protein [Vagococcus fluvialis]|uniref:GtrA family protein n=1 Tax=Vagococcus fluvialis TaxID=2738 RepID=UPI003B5A9377